MSQVIVLDTHIWIWFITHEFERFPAHWRDAIETAEQVGISPVSCFEVALAHQRERLEHMPTRDDKPLKNILKNILQKMGEA